MIRTQAEARAFLAGFETSHPGAFALARVVSLAARVEPELLRAARLRLLRRYTAGDEADFWFSECVESSGSLWVLLVPVVAEELRAGLKREDAQRARDLIVEMHKDAAPLVQLEETIHWLSLGGPARRKHIEDALRPVLQAVRQPDDEGVAQWAAHTIPRFSTWVRELPIAWAIRIVAEQRLGGTIAVDATSASVPPEAAAILRDLLPMTEVWVRRVAAGVEISRERLLGGHTIAVPATEPIALTVTGSEGTHPVALRGGVHRLPVRGPLTIATMTGTSWEMWTTHAPEQEYVSFRFAGGAPLPAGPIHVAFSPSRMLLNPPREWLEPTESEGRPFVTGKHGEDSATTIEADGALIGIVELASSVTTATEFIARMHSICSEPPDIWTARHHTSVLVLADDVITFVLMEHWDAVAGAGFSFVVHPGSSMKPKGLLAVSTSWPFAGELHIGPEPKLLLRQQDHPDKTDSVPIHLRPLPLEHREPTQWVLIAGSSYRIDPYVAQVARAVGQELAREGIGLITGGWPGIDEIVALAYAEALPGRAAARTSIQHILGSIQPRAEVPGERQLLSNDQAAVRESIRRADAVLLIAGYGGTAWVAEETRLQQKPFIPIPQTGGAAARIAQQRPAELWWEAKEPHLVARSAVGAVQLRGMRVDFPPMPIREGVQFAKVRNRPRKKKAAAKK